MKKRQLIFLLLPALLIASSCNDIFRNESALEGTYDWKRTTGGILGLIITPDSVNYTQKLVVDDDRAFLYRNEEVKTTFTVKFGKTEWMEEASWIFYPKKGAPFYIINKSELKNGKLTLFPSCTDCFIIYFKKR